LLRERCSKLVLSKAKDGRQSLKTYGVAVGVAVAVAVAVPVPVAVAVGVGVSVAVAEGEGVGEAVADAVMDTVGVSCGDGRGVDVG
jgi:hypothetical protein